MNGAMGPQGNIGITGSQGLVGLTGLTGLSGTNGLQGPQGLNGIAGINGMIGVVGATGPMGPQGSMGSTGAQGIIGLTGATGLQGPQGFDGLAGGATGATGPIGPKGDMGLTGSTGADGPQGITGTSGLNGVDGITGTTGLQGVTGANGLTGDIGPIGPSGSIGPTGLTGSTGVFDTSTPLSPVNGGTGIANNVLSTISIAGANPMTFTNTGSTSITLPESGTLYGTAPSSFSSLELLNSLSDKTGTDKAVFANSPVFTNIPEAPTASIGTNTTQLATTAFVMQNNMPTQFSITSGNEINTTSTSDVVAGNMNWTPGAGKYFVTFNGEYTIATSDRIGISKTDLSTLYTNLMAKTHINTQLHDVTFTGGTTFTPGIYYTTAASTAAGTITLNGLDDPNAEFIFKFAGAFSTNTPTTINLIRGASACNVYWIAEGAIALGANTSMVGTMIANNGAITTASGSSIVGRLYSTAGAIGFDLTTLSLPLCTSPTNYGMLNSFAAFTSAGGVTNTGASIFTGDIGTDVGAITGFESATINGNYFAPSLISRATANFSIYQNGIIIPFSTRTRISTLNLAEISLTAITDQISAGQAIDIRWKIDAGTIKLQNRILTLIEVK
jgi:hypothetical protein